MQDRCARNRKRSQRRAIYCPHHRCHLDSVSAKYPLFADTSGQLQVRGMALKTSRLVMAIHGVVALEGEWIERFWCLECQATEWYHVHKIGNREYKLDLIPEGLWKNATGVVNPYQNPSVSEYSFRESRGYSAYGLKGFRSQG